MQCALRRRRKPTKTWREKIEEILARIEIEETETRRLAIDVTWRQFSKIVKTNTIQRRNIEKI